MTTNLIHNAFTENLGTDFVALNPAGVPIGRASSRESLEQAHAGADVQILDATELAKLTPTLAEAVTAKLDAPFAAVVAQGVAENALAEPGKPTGAEDTPVEPVKEKPAKDPFDHDNSGSAGGSKKGTESTAHKGAEAKKAAAHAKK